MLSYDKTDGSILAPVRIWKEGKAALKRLWLNHLGTGENGQVQYIGVMKEEEDGAEQEEEEWGLHLTHLKPPDPPPDPTRLHLNPSDST